MTYPALADMVIVQHYWWDERTRNGVNASVTFTPKTIGSTGTITPNLTDAAEKAWIKTRAWKVTPDGMTGYLAVPLTPNDDPDLTAFGGYEVAPDGETARTVAIPSSAGTTTVTTQMQAALAKLSPPITVTVGATVKTVWLTDVATISNPPTPPNSFFTADQTQAAIAAGVLAHDDDTAAHPDIRALVQNASIADATTTVKGKAKILGGTADNPTVPYSAVTGAPTALPPSGGAGGVLGGTYPNPSFAVDMATQSELDAVAASRLPTLVPTTTFTSGSHTPASGEMARYAPTSNVSVTLPAASGSQRFGVANVLAGTSTFTATFTCAGADTFSDGSTSLVLKPGERAVLIGASGGFTIESRTVIGAGALAVRSVSGNTTAVAGELLKVDASGGARTITPPSSPATGTQVVVVKVDSTSNAVTWSGTVDGDAQGVSLTAQWVAATFVFDGTAWLLESTTVSPTQTVASVNGRTGAVTGLAEMSSLSTVATSGSYADLSSKPTIPAAYTDEQARDALGAALVAGTNVTITVNDAADTITIASSGGGTVSDATTSAKGIVQLAGDLGGTAATPTVPGKTALTVNGTFQSTYDLDTTPVTPADIGAEQTANKNVANGYAGLNAFSQVLIGNLPTGNGAGNVTVGNDSRLSDTRTPTDGTVTDAKVASGAAIAESKLSLASDAVAGTASRRTLGTGAQQAAAGNDSRITGATQKASNLSDLASASTARTNLGLATVAATGSYTDLSNTPTIPAAYTDEQARDALGAALVAGANVTITVDDAADTITVAASGGLTSAQAAGRALILGS